MTDANSPVVLIIMDGWGLAPPSPGNAISQAKTPFYNQLMAAYPHTQLTASGEAVGLPHGEDGNTEVGHVNIGAGQIVFQDLPRINTAIADGSFYTNPVFSKIINHVKTNQSTLHLLGLIGSGGVHANNEHLYSLIKLASLNQIPRLSLHLFTDGRDSPPTTGEIYIAEIKQHLQRAGIGQIASIMGRYYAMDRDFRWDRTEKAYRCLTEGFGLTATSPEQAIRQSYQLQKTDEFIEPTIIVDSSNTPLSLIKDNDAVIFYNYRVDRPRQLTKAFVLPDFANQANQLAFDPLADKYLHSHLPQKASTSPPFTRQIFLKNLLFTTMTEYQKNLPVQVITPPVHVDYPLSRVLSEYDKKQFHLSETEKERFVTYYFNGLREQPFVGEDWEFIQSPKVATYDLTPAMSSAQLVESVLKAIQKRYYHFIVVNFACPDMVAHTGNLAAAVQACEAMDQSLTKIVPAILGLKGYALITADHGNVEEMLNLQTGAVDTEHSMNPVPFIVAAQEFQGHYQQLPPGILADIAPTILKLMDIPKPNQMTGKSLI